MESFVLFPPEIQTHILCFLSHHELAYLFDLEEMFQHQHKQQGPENFNKSSNFRSLKYQALYALFHRKPLLLSNDFASKSMPLCHLRKLLDLGVHITPSEVNIHVYDFTDYEGSFSLWDCFSPSMFLFLSQLRSKINIELVLWENTPLDPSILRAWLEPLILNNVRVSSCTIRYSSALGFSIPRQGEDLDKRKLVNDIGSISPNVLQFNFLGPIELSRHLSFSKSCISLECVRNLDLSFNQLTDLDLRSLCIPQTIEVLNLSNNALNLFDCESLPFEELTALKSLDLSNNNIMRLETHHRVVKTTYPLKKLNLSGNFLSIYGQLFASDVFANLRDLDLSHNLISQITPFCRTMRRVNLAGNYITAQARTCELCFPKTLEIVGVDQVLVRDLYEVNDVNVSGCKP